MQHEATNSGQICAEYVAWRATKDFQLRTLFDVTVQTPVRCPPPHTPHPSVARVCPLGDARPPWPPCRRALRSVVAPLSRGHPPMPPPPPSMAKRPPIKGHPRLPPLSPLSPGAWWRGRGAGPLAAKAGGVGATKVGVVGARQAAAAPAWPQGHRPVDGRGGGGRGQPGVGWRGVGWRRQV